VQVATNQVECVRHLKRNLADGFEPGYSLITNVSFAHDDNHRVLLKGRASDKGDATTSIYVRTDQGEWHLAEVRSDIENGTSPDLQVREAFNEPPALVATDPINKRSKVILDPNPQLKNITFGKAELYDWRDRTGRAWQGILYKPVGYLPHVKYPLVIQNHGFNTSRYVPSGGYPSAFAAEELSSAGIMVLQVRDCDGRSTHLEGHCNVEGYEGAVLKLSREGMIDPSRVGIIGFSRTVYYVLEALTTSSVKFKAASITDGVTFGYMNYLLSVGPNRTYQNEQVAVIGAEPFGQGLAKWTRSSPVFNLDKVTTPLRVVATRGSGVAGMWEPYALLEAMHKPVDLIVLNTREHVLLDPTVRLSAQSGNVDWFRFWLQDYEDPDPAKQEQYARWRRLRDEMHPR
jgi:dipeptidyl aminopeptidase/acylaminoacyl peptidase